MPRRCTLHLSPAQARLIRDAAATFALRAPEEETRERWRVVTRAAERALWRDERARATRAEVAA